MKKYRYLPVLLLAIFLLLCACAQNVTDQPETTPSSSVQPNSKPTSKPTSTPTIIPTVATQPTTAPTQPTTAPTKPTTPPDPVESSTAWVTSREIVPFEERFAEDTPFFTTDQSYRHRPKDYWFAPDADGTYVRYILDISVNANCLAVYRGKVAERTLVYEIPVATNLADCQLLSSDGHWAYLSDGNNRLKVDLTTGEHSVVLTRNPDAILWQERSYGMDTLCVFEVDGQNNLTISYRDLHSDGKKILYTGVLPLPITEDLTFTAPDTTLGQVTWQMMNPAFYAQIQKELNDPNSQFNTDKYAACWTDPQNHPVTIETEPFLCIAIQNHYDIPARVRYILDIKTGQLITDYGIIDSCERGSGDYNDHYNYENTWETPLEIVAHDPVNITNFTKLTDAQIAEDLEDEYNAASGNVFLYRAFGYAHAYWRLNELDGATYVRPSDILFKEATASPHYIYGITPENTVIQLSVDGSICNTVYTSQNTLSEICYHAGSVYILDGDQVIRINAITGTCTVILRCDGWVRLDTWGSEDKLYILVVQGLYNQQYFFDPDTGILREESFI